jgi:hypothetical protein
MLKSKYLHSINVAVQQYKFYLVPTTQENERKDIKIHTALSTITVTVHIPKIQ